MIRSSGQQAFEPLDAEQERLKNQEILERRRAFEREAVPHLDAVYHFAYNLTGNGDDARDLLQETFLKAFRFFNSFQQGTNCKAWLFQISKNSFINRYRKQTREPNKVSYDEIEEYYETLRPINADANNLEQHLFDELLDDDVTSALQALPEAFRSVLILSDIESMTYEEIAEILHCPIGTVRSRLHRARKMVRDRLSDYAKTKGFNKNNTSSENTRYAKKNANNENDDTENDDRENDDRENENRENDDRENDDRENDDRENDDRENDDRENREHKANQNKENTSNNDDDLNTE
jgi:RNA polymerase sigma-70 factor, ECF subfamily